MLTLDDQRTRVTLISTIDAYQDPKRWTTGCFNRYTNDVRDGGCMMGEVMYNMGTLATSRETDPLYVSICSWFGRAIYAEYGPRKSRLLRVCKWTPEGFNDHFGYNTVCAFLARRLVEIEAEILRNASAPPTDVARPPAPVAA